MPKIIHDEMTLSHLCRNLVNLGIDMNILTNSNKSYIDVSLDALLVLYAVTSAFNKASYDEYARGMGTKPTLVHSRVRTARDIIKDIVRGLEVAEGVILIRNIFECDTKLAKKIYLSAYYNDIRSGAVKRYLEEIPNDIKGRAVKVFISQPMTFICEETFMTARKELLKQLEDFFPGIKFVVINPYQRPDAPKDAGQLWYLGRAIQDMQLADVVIFSPDYDEAHGCRVEKLVCSEYHLPEILMSFLQYHTVEDDGYDETYEKFKKINKGVE